MAGLSREGSFGGGEEERTDCGCAGQCWGRQMGAGQHTAEAAVLSIWLWAPAKMKRCN